MIAFDAMALDLGKVGTTGEVFRFECTWQNPVSYALAVGAKTSELDYVYEGRGPKVLPTYAVVPTLEPVLALAKHAGVDFATILHGEQAITLHRAIPAQGTFLSRAKVEGMYDKGKNALVVLSTTTSDEAGTKLFDTTWSLFARGAGGFGGEKSPAAEVPAQPSRVADFSVTEITSPEQAAQYRLSGDHNPLHIDPEAAKKAGFERPILHGLCTYGFAGRAILQNACDGNLERFAGFSARFSGVVLPGDQLTTEGWQLDNGRWLVQAKKSDNTVVLSQGIATVRG